MEIENVHELPADELQDILDAARCYLKDGFKSEANTILNAIADSIKKSLIYFFPKYCDLIMEVVDSNEAMYAISSWAQGHYPLCDGVKALRRIYEVVHSCDDFDFFIDGEMQSAVKAYAGIASQDFLQQKMEKALPFIGKKNKKGKPTGRQGVASLAETLLNRRPDFSNKQIREYIENNYVDTPYKCGRDGGPYFEVYFDPDNEQFTQTSYLYAKGQTVDVMDFDKNKPKVTTDPPMQYDSFVKNVLPKVRKKLKKKLS